MEMHQTEHDMYGGVQRCSSSDLPMHVGTGSVKGEAGKLNDTRRSVKLREYTE